MVPRFNWCDQNVLWTSSPADLDTSVPQITCVSLNADREAAAEWKNRDKKNRKFAERLRLLWPKIEYKDFVNTQIFVNETNWWPETTLDNMTSFQRALASPFEETTPNGGELPQYQYQLWNCTHFRRPTDDQLQPSDIHEGLNGSD